MEKSKKSKLSDPKLILDRYTVLEKLGEGTYGKVYKVFDEKSGQIFAIKAMKTVEDYNTFGFPATTLREISAFKTLAHKNVLELIDLSEPNPGEFYLIFPFIPLNLHQYICHARDTNTPITPKKVQVIIFQLVQAVAHVHSRRFLHRDLKPLNILMTEDGEVKLADFGLARTYSPCVPRPLTREVATLWYRSPELILGDNTYTYELDMWGVGVIMLELLEKQPPFRATTELEMLYQIFQLLGTPSPDTPYFRDYAKKLSVLPKFKPQNLTLKYPDLPPEGHALLRKLLTVDPTLRGQTFEVLRHPFFQLEL